jgi:hypothetical protein
LVAAALGAERGSPDLVGVRARARVEARVRLRVRLRVG